jgi:uncharacterized protein (TIGR02594 family)
MSLDVQAIQRALKEAGFDPGEIDGVWGRRTIGAVRAFQRTNALEVDGVVGPETVAALFGGQAAGDKSQPVVWYEEARRHLGMQEQRGPGSNRKLLDWADDLDIEYKSDDIPWCGLFVAHCVGSTLPAEVLPRSPLMARGWKSCGRQTSPRLGAIMVFWRGSKEGSLGHVGLYAGEDQQAYHILGGNQSDSVSVARISKRRLLEARWPATAASVESTPVHFAAGESILSTNEA